MRVKEFDDIDIYKKALYFLKIGKEAVREAKEKNRKLGIPNVFSKNGKLYYELPNGEITTKDPFK